MALITKQFNASLSPCTYSKFHMDVTLTDFLLKLGQLNLYFSKQIEKQCHRNVMRYHIVTVSDALGPCRTSYSCSLTKNFQPQASTDLCLWGFSSCWRPLSLWTGQPGGVGELTPPGNCSQPMTDGGWCRNIPTASLLGWANSEACSTLSSKGPQCVLSPGCPQG